jgi:hypothetical protein
MITFVKIKNSDEHLKETFRLLGLRKRGISHHEMPSFEDHKIFVANYPYRYWFLIRHSGSFIGSLYLTNENVIGLNIVAERRDLIQQTIIKVLDEFNPLPPIKSVRNKSFLINVSVDDDNLASSILNLGGVEIQRTFLIPSKYVKKD